MDTPAPCYLCECELIIQKCITSTNQQNSFSSNVILLDMKTEYTLFSIGGVWSQTRTSLVPGSWGSMCLAYTAGSALWNFYTEGKERASGTLQSSKGERLIYFGTFAATRFDQVGV